MCAPLRRQPTPAQPRSPISGGHGSIRSKQLPAAARIHSSILCMALPSIIAQDHACHLHCTSGHRFEGCCRRAARGASRKATAAAAAACWLPASRARMPTVATTRTTVPPSRSRYDPCDADGLARCMCICLHATMALPAACAFLPLPIPYSQCVPSVPLAGSLDAVTMPGGA